MCQVTWADPKEETRGPTPSLENHKWLEVSLEVQVQTTPRNNWSQGSNCFSGEVCTVCEIHVRFAIISLRNRELVAILYMCSCCRVELLFLAVDL